MTDLSALQPKRRSAQSTLQVRAKDRRTVGCPVSAATLFTIGLAIAAPAAHALDQNSIPTLKPSPAIAPGLAAFPRLIAAPGDRAAERINQALDRADDRARAALKDCRSQAEKIDWTRSIDVTMRGPRFLSFVVSSSWYCGGAYPDYDKFPLVYDLTTGAPVNWNRLLPAALLGKVGTDYAGDGTVVGTASSTALHDLYLKGNKIDQDCKEALADPSMTFTIWPSASTPGISIQPFGLVHAVVGCANERTFPLTVWRSLKVHPDLLDAIEKAHAHVLYDPQKPPTAAQ